LFTQSNPIQSKDFKILSNREVATFNLLIGQGKLMLFLFKNKKKVDLDQSEFGRQEDGNNFRTGSKD